MAAEMELTKLDVAERQLNQAIELFLNCGDPVSIHTLAEAAGQVLYDIRDSFGGQSAFRDSDRIRPEYLKDWRQAISAAKNFFKHADRDRDTKLTFQPRSNEFSLFDACQLLLAAKKAWTPHTQIFMAWFYLEHPSWIREDSDMGPIMKKHALLLEMDKVVRTSQMARILNLMRTGAGLTDLGAQPPVPI